MKIFLLLFTTSFLFTNCYNKPKKTATDDIKFDMIQADKNFSKLCEEKGIKAAFLEFIDSNGVMLKPNMLPLTGAEAIDFILQSNDTTATMSWTPKGGNVAESGEMGYTYGVYQIKPKNVDTFFAGTYVSIWKKQPDGKWKFILDSGNEGIE